MFILAEAFILISSLLEVVPSNTELLLERCEPILQITNGSQISKAIYEVKYTKRNDTIYKLGQMVFVSDETSMEFPAHLVSEDNHDGMYSFSMKDLNPNESYTLNITYEYEVNHGSCISSTSSRFTKRGECGPLMEITNVLQVSEDILKVGYTKRKKKFYKLDTLEGKYISHKTWKEFNARLTRMSYPDGAFYFSMKELYPNESYTLNITYEYGPCKFSTSSIFTKQYRCEPILQITNGSQISEDIYEVKYTKRIDTIFKLGQMEFVSDKTSMEFPAHLVSGDDHDGTYYFLMKDLNPNVSYTLNITYEYEVNNGSCISSTSSRFTKRDKCGSIMEITNILQVSENTLKVGYSKTERKYYRLDKIEATFISHKTGEEFIATMINVSYSDGAFYFSIRKLNSNESFTLNITYEYESCKSSTSSIFTKRDIQTPKKKNYYLFIAAIVIVSFVIILMLIYSGQKSKLELLVKKVKNLVPCYGNRQDSVSEFNFDLSDSVGRQEINPLYQSLEQYAVQNDDSFEFPREKIEMKQIIGEGEFGEVHYAKAYGILGRKGYAMVAVKQIKSNPSQQARADFLMEINTLKKIGRHSNIVQMLACVTQSEPFMIIMELIRKGNLKDYLLELRKIWDDCKNTKFFDGEMDYSYVKPDRDDNRNESQSKEWGGEESEDNIVVYETEATTPILAEASPPPFPVLDHMELQCFASQIACGMAHLEKIGITHRDLAARNILITKEKLLKITDFGMSRPGPYVNTNMDRRIPLRWCSIEAIKELKTNNKSDVWSFGVVLWEIGTLGAFPYGNMVCNEVINYLKSGKRLGRPEICTDELYDVMLRCWRENPEDRPSFSELVKLLNVEKRHVYLEFRKISPNYVFPETFSE